MSSNVVDYSQFGPVTEVNVMCDTCPTTIEIYFEQPATFLVLGAEAECCSKSWFSPNNNYDCISSRVRAELNQLVGHRISTAIDKGVSPVLFGAHTVSLAMSMTFYFGNTSLVLWLLNESDNGHSGSISERLHVLSR